MYKKSLMAVCHPPRANHAPPELTKARNAHCTLLPKEGKKRTHGYTVHVLCLFSIHLFLSIILCVRRALS